MAKWQRTEEFESWVGGASEETVKKWIRTIKFRQAIYTIAWFICVGVSIGLLAPMVAQTPIVLAAIVVLVGLPMGCAIFCETNAKLLKTRGNRASNQTNIGMMTILGLFIVPIIVVRIAANSEKVSKLILGV